jgi:lipopolysaccharide exporter
MKNGLAGGAAWMVLFRMLDRSIGILSTLVLARLLLPADFGLVAMAMSVISLVELATAFSFEIALIQMSDPKRHHYDTAWTLNIAVALGGGAITALLAPLTAHFYSEPRLIAVMLVIAVAWAVSGFENIGVVEFRRSMNFRREFVFFGYKRITTFVVTMVCGFAFRSHWALVTGMVTGRLTGVALSYLMQRYRPRLSFVATRELLSFSGWMVGNNLIGVALGRVPHFFVGRILGS